MTIAGVMWLAIVLVTALAIAVIVARRALAEMQALVVGGRISPGCVVAEGLALLLVALAIYLARNQILR